MKRNQLIRMTLSLLLCLSLISPALADVLRIPSGVKVIEEEAFYGDESLDEVVLPDSVEIIGDRAFAESGLTKINLPNEIVDIGDDAIDPGVIVEAEEGTYSYNWAVMQGLIDQTPPEYDDNHCIDTSEQSDGRTVIQYANGSVLTIDSDGIPETLEWSDGKFLFADIPGYPGEICINAYIGSDSTVSIPDSIQGFRVTVISESAFENSNSLKKVTIPDSVEYIGESAFQNCTSLITVTLPSGLEGITQSMFAGCISLKNIKWPDRFSGAIQSDAFMNCSSLVKIQLPIGLTGIWDDAFSGCSGLQEIILPWTLQSIGERAFENCLHLQKVIFDLQCNPTIMTDAFKGCSAIAFYGSDNRYNNSNYRHYADMNSIPLYVSFLWPKPAESEETIEILDIIPYSSNDFICKLSFNYESQYPNGGILVKDKSGNIIQFPHYSYDSAISLYEEYENELEEGYYCVANGLKPGTYTVVAYKFDEATGKKIMSKEKTVELVSNETKMPLKPHVKASVRQVPDNPNIFYVDIYWNSDSVDAYDTEEYYATFTTNYIVDMDIYELNDEGVPFLSDTLTFINSFNGATSTQYFNCDKTYKLSFYISAMNGVGTTERYGPYVLNRYEWDWDNSISEIPIEFTMQPSAILVGNEVTFSVTAPGASKIRLVVDGVSYDGDIHDLDANGRVTFSRRITKYAETRSISFRALVNGEWTRACEPQILSMSTNGELKKAKINKLPEPHRTGNSLQIVWTAVDFADDYTLYFYNGNTGEQTIFDDIVKIDEGHYGVTIPADFFEEGRHGISVMACGEGYSQSESGTNLWVRPPYEVKQGWAQAEKVYTYILKDGKFEQYGWFDYTETVDVLDELDDYYYIEMRVYDDYGGGTARRYVRKDAPFLIGDENCRWSPDSSMTVTYLYEYNNSVSVKINVTGLVATEAGIMLGEETVDSSSVSQDTYNFNFYPENGLNTYLVYVKNETIILKEELILSDDPDDLAEIPSTLEIRRGVQETDTDNDAVSTNVNPQINSTIIGSMPWTVYYTLSGDELGIGVFAINRLHQNGSVTYEYVKSGTKETSGSYLFSLNPLNAGEKGYLSSVEVVDGFKHYDVEYAFIPLRFAQKVGNSYYISKEAVDSLLDYEQTHNQKLVDICKHYFFFDFSNDYELGHCKVMSVDLNTGRSTDDNEMLEPGKYKVRKALIGDQKYYVILKNDNGMNLIYYAKIEQFELALNDAMNISNYNLSVSKNWFGDYKLTVKPRNDLATLIFDGTITTVPNKLYAVCRWLENDNYKYAVLDDVSSCFRNGYADVSLTPELAFDREYEFAIVCDQDDFTVHNANYFYSYYIPVKDMDEREQSLRLLVYAYDHGLNALTGLNKDNGEEDQCYKEKTSLLIRYVSNKIGSCGLNSTETMAIINELIEAPDNERNLYLFSIWDYDVELDKSTSDNNTYYMQPMLIFGDKIVVSKTGYGVGLKSQRDFLSVWFHESGHAADYHDPRYSGGMTSRESNVYENYMIPDFYDLVYKAANGVRVDKKVVSEKYPSYMTNILARCLLDNCRGDCEYYKQSFVSYITPVMVSAGCSWQDAYETTKEMLTDQILEYCSKLNYMNQQGYMFSDALLGMMDNLFYESGMLYHEDGYWFIGPIRKGKQESEAFAEYFASRIGKTGLEVNNLFFPRTCRRFETLVFLAVQSYREKYKDFAK